MNIIHGLYNIKLTMFCLGNFLKIENCEGVFSYMQSSYIQVNTIRYVWILNRGLYYDFKVVLTNLYSQVTQFKNLD